MKQLEPRRKSIKKELTKWSKKTTISGIPKITESKGLLSKFIWISVIVLFSVILMQKILGLILEYYNYNVITRIKLESTENLMPFPAVTFKLINWLNFKKFKHSIHTISDLSDYIENSNENDLKENFFISKSNFMASYYILKSAHESQDSLESDMILNSIYSCQFNGQKCSLKDFNLVKPEGDAALLQFNTDQPVKKINKFGKNSGLSLEIFAGFRQNQSPVSQDSGVLIYIHEPNKTIMIDDHGVLLRPGTHTNIELHKTSVRILPEPFNLCASNANKPNLNESFLYEMTLNLTKSYSQKYCFDLCYQNEIIQNCDCYDEKVLKFVNYKHRLQSCNDKFDIWPSVSQKSKKPKYYLTYDDYQLSCPSLVKEAFYAGDYVTKCSKYCPRECNYKKYSSTISKSKYPSRFYSSILLNNTNLKQIMQLENRTSKELLDSVLSVNIYFGSDEFTSEEEVPLKSLNDLISELGENLGLFLGLSALSTFEIIDLFIKLLSVSFTSQIAAKISSLKLTFCLTILKIFNFIKPKKVFLSK